MGAVNYALLERLEQEAGEGSTKLDNAIQSLRNARRRFRDRHIDSDPAPPPDAGTEDDGRQEGTPNL